MDSSASKWQKETSEGWRCVRTRLQRIGLKRLWSHPDGRWAVSLENRSYEHWLDVAPEKLLAWKERFR